MVNLKQEKENIKVGDIVIMENAGGWSYSHYNNGCEAIVTNVGSRIDIFDNEELVFTISGKVLNPKINKYIEFRNIPIMNTQGQVVFYKKPTQIIELW